MKFFVIIYYYYLYNYLLIYKIFINYIYFIFKNKLNLKLIK